MCLTQWEPERPCAILITFTQHAGLLHFPGRKLVCPFYRDNETMSLYLREDKDFEFYQTNILNELKFSWRGFKVNGLGMKKIKSTGVNSMEGLN